MTKHRLVLVVLGTILIVLGAGAYAITHTTTKDDFGPPQSASQQHQAFCAAVRGPGQKASPTKLLAGDETLGSGASLILADYVAVVAGSDHLVPIDLRADYHQFLTEAQRRESTPGHRDLVAVVVVDQAVRDCLSRGPT